jgi:hypothetical protein
MMIFCFSGRAAWRALVLGAALIVSGARAEGADMDVDTDVDETVAQTPDVFSTKSDLLYEFDAEGRLTFSAAGGIRILRESAIERMKTANITYRRGLQEVRVKEAYTLKADGRRVPVPSGNYQTVRVDDADNPFASQWERIVIAFPDVAVGDTLHLDYTIADNAPNAFPGAVSVNYGFSEFAAVENTAITVRAPASLRLKTESHRLEVEPPGTRNGIETYRWRYRNPKPRVVEPERDHGVWRIGERPEVFMSTFADYAALSRAYGELALPRARVTERVRQLAAEIVGAETDRREQARLLYEWVSRELSYAGDCIAIGALTPRDLDVVIENRMGDCKDHAGLLQALLSARGIPSEQALLAKAYDLPVKTPIVWSIARVINYLPEWDMYVDTVTGSQPFGYLPWGYYGRPVVHVGVANPVRTLSSARIPVPEQDIETELKLDANGHADGRVTVRLKGPAAATTRAYFMDMRAEDREQFVESLLGRQGARVEGVLDTGDLSPERRLSDTYEFGIRFSFDNFLRTKNGALTLSPLLSSGPTMAQLADYDDTKELKRDQTCWGLRVRETYDIVLEDGVRFTQLPEPMTRDTEYLGYESRVETTPRGVKVSRVLTDKTPMGVCSADFMNAWIRDAVIIAENLEQQVFYQRAAATAETGERKTE